MDLNKYLFPLRKWWRLVVASTLIAAIFSSVSVLLQPDVYQARTTLMIGTTITDPNPSGAEISLGQQLASAYADLANREIVYNATRNALGTRQLPEYFAWAIPQTQLIEITVSDTNPERAQIVANELAAQLINLSPISSQSEEQGRQEFIHERLTNLEIQIRETEAEIETLQGELANTFSAQQIEDIQNQISSLQSKLTTMENNYGLLLANTQQGAVNTLTVIERAETPSRPIGPVKGTTILLAATAGFILAAATAYLLEYLDDTLKSPDDVTRLFSAPIIGRIFEHEEAVNESQLYDPDGSTHPLTEPFRALRTVIEFAEVDHPLKTILVSSPDIGDGKTSVAVNLALSIAQRGKKVFLLDADLRKPRIHRVLNLSNDQGLADLVFARNASNWRIGIKKVKDVSVFTAGGIPPNPTELLSSKKMEQFLSELKETADVIIIDSPPFIVPDAMILAGKVDGILIAIRPSHTRRSLAKVAMDNIKLVGAKVVGVVLNRIPLRGADFYAGKSYLSTYLSNYGDERQGKEEDIAFERLRETLSPMVNKVPEKYRVALSPYANKATNFIRYLFEAVFKLSPK